MKSLATISDEIRQAKEDIAGSLLGFDAPIDSGAWRIRRADGLYYAPKGLVRGWTTDHAQAIPFLTRDGAQHYLDIELGSQAGRAAMRDCAPCQITDPNRP